MTIRAVLEHTDPRLRMPTARVETIDDRILGVIADLVQTMRFGGRPAIGIAAPQIGELVRVFVMQETLEGGREKIYACINPEITHRAGRTGFSEGCLSFPDATFVRTERSERVKLRFTDRQGLVQEKKLSGLLAVCAQHELDHLDGKLMTDLGELQTRKEP
jgi:peptide deformylase